jgi:hypothetical protein
MRGYLTYGWYGVLVRKAWICNVRLDNVWLVRFGLGNVSSVLNQKFVLTEWIHMAEVPYTYAVFSYKSDAYTRTQHTYVIT